MNELVFPRAVYRRGTYPGQVDHVGWLSMVVSDASAWAAAQKDGWQLDMHESPPPAPDPRVEMVEYDAVTEPDGGVVIGTRRSGRRWLRSSSEMDA